MDELHIRIRTLAVGLLIAVTMIPSFPLTNADATAKLSLAPASISLSTIPPNLPADNNTYPAIFVSVVDKNHQATVALTNLDIFLTSSQENVGEVTANVQIAAGQTYVIANFTTTNKAGSTVITATTSGLLSASTSVSTVVAVGYPTRLVLAAVPGNVPARASNTGKLIMELEDDVGLPAKAISDISVSIYSSNTHVVNVTQPSATMKQGDYLEEVDYASGFIPGTAVITASAAGFDSGVASITVQGSPPLGLKLFAQPDKMVACTTSVTSCTGRLVVALTDLSGNPTRAASNIEVQIRSSDLAVVSTVETAIIEAGNISATAIYAVTNNPGITTMTASAPGLKSSSTVITTLPPAYVSPDFCTSGTSSSCKLEIFAGPNPVLADHRSYSSVVVSLANSTGFPAINMTGPTKVTLTSAVTGVGNFSQVVFTIPEGQNWAAITFTSTFQVGATQLTASGQNLLPVQTGLATYGPVPSQVVLTPISSTLPADGASHPALELSLEDSFGSPAVAPFDVPVSLSSSHSDIANVAPVVIPSGQTFVVANVTAGIVPGKANVTALESAFTSGYATSWAVLTAVVPAPSALAAYVPAGGLMSTALNPLHLIAIQLQGASANPARARVPMNITIASSNSTVVRDTLEAAVDVGKDYTAIAISALAPGATTLTFSTPGLASTSLLVTFLPYPVQIGISGGPPSILTTGTSVISVSVMVDGTPFPGASVSWNASSGGFTLTPHQSANESSSASTSSTITALSMTTSTASAAPQTLAFANDTTDKGGSSTIIYRPSRVGSAIITAAVNALGLPTKNLNFTVTASAPLQTVKAKPSLIQQLTSFPLILAPIGGVGGVGVAAFFLIRRRGKGSSGEEEFDSSLQ